tara:strand:- start:319 stop:474 length:156 start_codon:yes stop_codon:yes gene_type:complete
MGISGAEARNPREVIAPFRPIIELPTFRDSKIRERSGDESPSMKPNAAAAA